jgi:threonine/homoserine/homoserine lactone efflux protein
VHLGAFFVISTVVIVAPGPDTALTFKNALLGGRRGGISTAAGSATGLLTWTLCSSIGIAALLRASEPAFLALRIAGASYLAYLGVRALWAAVRAGAAETSAPLSRGIRPATAYRQGLLSNLGNPKIAVFFISLLPQITGGHTSFSTFLTLGAIFCAMTFAWLSAYSFAVAKAGDFLRQGAVRRALDAVTGLVLVGFGLRLATES